MALLHFMSPMAFLSPMAFYESQSHGLLWVPTCFYESHCLLWVPTFFSIFIIFINFFLLWVREIGTLMEWHSFPKMSFQICKFQAFPFSTHIAFASIILVAFLIEFSTFSSTKLMQASLTEMKILSITKVDFNKRKLGQTKFGADKKQKYDEQRLV